MGHLSVDWENDAAARPLPVPKGEMDRIEALDLKVRPTMPSAGLLETRSDRVINRQHVILAHPVAIDRELGQGGLNRLNVCGA